MKSFTGFLALLAASATASPTQGSVLFERGAGDTSTNPKFTNCEAASNCEVYDGPHGKAIRFKVGHEPGTDNYKAIFGNSSAPLKTRQASDPDPDNDNPHALIDMGSNKLKWGTQNPWDILNHLYTPCQESSCDESGYYVGSQAVADYASGAYIGTQPTWFSVILFPSGTYDGYGFRNSFIPSIQQMSIQNQEWDQADWSYDYYNADTGAYTQVDSGSIWECHQVDYFSVSQWGYDHSLQGFMDVLVKSDFEDSYGGVCSDIDLALGAAQSVVSPLLGIPAALINIFCGYD